MMASGELDMNPFRHIEDFQAETAPIVTPEELDTYVHAYEKTGFRGGIDWYRNIDRNSREHPEIGVTKLTLPCLMITAEWDGALPPRMAAGCPRYAPISRCTTSSAQATGCSRNFPTR